MRRTKYLIGSRGSFSLLVFALLLANITCSPKVRSIFATGENAVIIRDPGDSSPASERTDCNDNINYAPDPEHPGHTPLRTIRINIHFMDAGPGLFNFDEYSGRLFALAVIDGCNDRLDNNVKMHLPPDNDTPVLPARYRLQLTPATTDPDDDGIYFHYDPELYYYIHGRNSNRTDKTVLNKYGVGSDSIMNIFLMPHHPDSVGRPNYKPAETGIALGGYIKISMLFGNNPAPSRCMGLLNHEVGHVLGLSHTWGGNDGCDDTPNHSNCWYYTDEPPCDSLVSNNMMDYNAWQHALTPCQIGKVHKYMASKSSRARRYTVQDWCNYNPEATIRIRDSVVWCSARDLSGDIFVDDNAVLALHCRVSLARGAKITVSPKGRLVLGDCSLENSCGDKWQGIELLYTKRDTATMIVTGKPSIQNALYQIELPEDHR